MRNDVGVEGLVAWRKIQARRDAPVRLSYGYAMTVDTAQGSTATEHIHALPAGSHAIHGFKAYTALSRHERTTWIVVDEASERRHLASRSMIGHRPEIHEPDLWRQHRRKSQPPAAQGQRARSAAPNAGGAPPGAAAGDTTGRCARLDGARQPRPNRRGSNPTSPSCATAPPRVTGLARDHQELADIGRGMRGRPHIAGASSFGLDDMRRRRNV